MYETANKLQKAAHEMGIGPDKFRQVGPDRWRDILKQVFQRFTNTYRFDVTWLWSHLKSEGCAVQTEDGLKYIGSLFKPEVKVWVLFEDWDRKKEHGNYWVYEGTYGATVAVLNNMQGIEYYIVDRNFNWMILENHHNVIIGVGEPAESFIRNLKID